MWREIDQAILAAVAHSSVDNREANRIRRAMLLRPLVRQQIRQLVHDNCCALGYFLETGETGVGIDWNDILALIRELVPLILELIDLFND